MATRKKEIYCNQRGCFQWVNPRQSLYCTNCEYNRKEIEDEEFEDEHLQQMLLESLHINELSSIELKVVDSSESQETKQECVGTQTSETRSSEITQGPFTDDSLERMLDLIAKEPTVDDESDESNLITHSEITQGPFTDDSLEMMLDLIAKEPTEDDEDNLITPKIPKIPKRRGILRLEKLVKK